MDTANRYGWGESEEIVGKALRGRRNDEVVATKVFVPGTAGNILDSGTSRRHLFIQVEESLPRLGTECAQPRRTYGMRRGLARVRSARPVR